MNSTAIKLLAIFRCWYFVYSLRNQARCCLRLHPTLLTDILAFFSHFWVVRNYKSKRFEDFFFAGALELKSSTEELDYTQEPGTVEEAETKRKRERMMKKQVRERVLYLSIEYFFRE